MILLSTTSSLTQTSNLQYRLSPVTSFEILSFHRRTSSTLTTHSFVEMFSALTGSGSPSAEVVKAIVRVVLEVVASQKAGTLCRHGTSCQFAHKCWFRHDEPFLLPFQQPQTTLPPTSPLQAFEDLHRPEDWPATQDPPRLLLVLDPDETVCSSDGRPSRDLSRAVAHTHTPDLTHTLYAHPHTLTPHCTHKPHPHTNTPHRLH